MPSAHVAAPLHHGKAVLHETTVLVAAWSHEVCHLEPESPFVQLEWVTAVRREVARHNAPSHGRGGVQQIHRQGVPWQLSA